MEDIIKSLIDNDTFDTVFDVLDYIDECWDNACKLEDVEDAGEPLESEMYKSIKNGYRYKDINFAEIEDYFEEYEQSNKDDQDHKDHISRLWDNR